MSRPTLKDEETIVAVKGLTITVKELGDKVDVFSRDLENARKTIDLLYADRGILEHIRGDLRSLEQELNSHREHHRVETKDLKADISDVQVAVDKNMSEIKEGIVQKENLIDKLKAKIGGEIK